MEPILFEYGWCDFDCPFLKRNGELDYSCNKLQRPLIWYDGVIAECQETNTFDDDKSREQDTEQ